MPLLSLFLILIPVVGWLLTIVVIAFWGFVKYDDIFKTLSETNTKHDVQEYIQTESVIPDIDTKRYNREDISDSELERMR